MENNTFLNGWHLTLDLLPPDGEVIWFLDREDNLRVGQYNDDVHAVGMADGYGFKIEDVKQWAFLSGKEVIGYPRDGETVAVELANLDCPALGMYSCRYDHPITGERKKAILLDPIYCFENTQGEVALEWPYVQAWYHIPKIDTLRPLEDACCGECCEEEMLPAPTPEEICTTKSAILNSIH